MMDFLALAAWLAVGLAGTIMIYRDGVYFDARLDRREPRYCPTPIHLIGIIIFSFAGLAAFIAGLIAMATTASIYGTKRQSWWTTPICKKREGAA